MPKALDFSEFSKRIYIKDTSTGAIVKLPAECVESKSQDNLVTGIVQDRNGDIVYQHTVVTIPTLPGKFELLSIVHNNLIQVRTSPSEIQLLPIDLFHGKCIDTNYNPECQHCTKDPSKCDMCTESDKYYKPNGCICTYVPLIRNGKPVLYEKNPNCPVHSTKTS